MITAVKCIFIFDNKKTRGRSAPPHTIRVKFEYDGNVGHNLKKGSQICTSLLPSRGVGPDQMLKIRVQPNNVKPNDLILQCSLINEDFFKTVATRFTVILDQDPLSQIWSF